MNSLSNNTFAVVVGPRRQQTEYSGPNYMFFSTQNLGFWVYGNDSILRELTILEYGIFGDLQLQDLLVGVRLNLIVYLK